MVTEIHLLVALQVRVEKLNVNINMHSVKSSTLS